MATASDSVKLPVMPMGSATHLEMVMASVMRPVMESAREQVSSWAWASLAAIRDWQRRHYCQMNAQL
jgi:uncharacterized protein with HEPN domain